MLTAKISSTRTRNSKHSLKKRKTLIHISKEETINMARRFSQTLKKRKAHHKLIRAINKSTDLKLTKIAKKIKDAKKFVKNFSSHILTDNEILLLSKGVKFIPTPKTERTTINLMKNFSEFERRMRCTYLYESGIKYTKHPFYLNTGFKPNYSCEAIENYLFATKYEISKIRLQKQNPNITFQEKKALRNLKQNDDIMIRKADKCSTLCILDKQNYITEGLRQLENNTYYEEITEPKTAEITQFVSEMIENIYSCKQIDDITYKFNSVQKNLANSSYFRKFTRYRTIF